MQGKRVTGVRRDIIADLVAILKAEYIFTKKVGVLLI